MGWPNPCPSLQSTCSSRKLRYIPAQPSASGFELNSITFLAILPRSSIQLWPSYMLKPMSVCLSVCLSVCISYVDVLSKPVVVKLTFVLFPLLCMYFLCSFLLYTYYVGWALSLHGDVEVTRAMSYCKSVQILIQESETIIIL